MPCNPQPSRAGDVLCAAGTRCTGPASGRGSCPWRSSFSGPSVATSAGGGSGGPGSCPVRGGKTWPRVIKPLVVHSRQIPPTVDPTRPCPLPTQKPPVCQCGRGFLLHRTDRAGRQSQNPRPPQRGYQPGVACEQLFTHRPSGRPLINKTPPGAEGSRQGGGSTGR